MLNSNQPLISIEPGKFQQKANQLNRNLISANADSASRAASSIRLMKSSNLPGIKPLVRQKTAKDFSND